MSEQLQTRTSRFEHVLALDGHDFLGQAYLLMLGRPIDPDGFRNYEHKLRSGISKVSILVELGASPEGRARGADLAELLPLLPQELVTMSGVLEAGAGNLQELLALEDAAFVEGAYRTLLRRPPDAVGFSHYLRLIRSGASKMRIVSQLLWSAEGRRAAPSLPGLRGAVWRYWLASSRLTGWWYRVITGSEGDTPLECRVRAVQNSLSRLVQERERESRDWNNAADDVARLLKALAERRSA
jgi:hypothetical protein